MKTTSLLICLLFCQWAYSQSNNSQLPTSMNHNGAAPDASAILDVQSNQKGVLIPRMSQAQRDAITAPATGLLIYQTNVSSGFYYYNGTGWQEIGDGVQELPAGGNSGDILQTDGSGSYAWVADQVDDADADPTNEIEIPNGGTISTTTRDDALYTANGFSYIGKTSVDVESSAAPEGWTATSTTGAPSGRDRHIGIWTGTVMIVWGGYGSSAYQNTGGKYDSATDVWTTTPNTGAPSARQYHIAIWTGMEMIVWGGDDGFSNQNTGGIYGPSIVSTKYHMYTKN